MDYRNNKVEKNLDQFQKQKYRGELAKRARRRRKKTAALISAFIICITACAALILCLTMVFRYRSLRLENTAVIKELEDIRTMQEVYYSQDETNAMIEQAEDKAKQKAAEETKAQILSLIKRQLSAGESVLKTIRQLFPNEIIIVADGSYHFIALDEQLKANKKINENYSVDENRLMHYVENGEELGVKGIDVSRYQGEIDWEKVAEDDVTYAFIRVGIRGYTEGEILPDEQFENNIKGADRNDIATGVYFFSQATSVEEAEEEAQFVLDAIEPYNITYPVVLDIEEILSSNARTAQLSAKERTDYCIAFCDMIEQAGYTPMIYGNLKTFMLMLEMDRIEKYPKWFACYDEQIYFPYEYAIWQYTDKGEVSGINGKVDMNISFYEP